MKIGIIYSGRFPWNRGIGQLYTALKSLDHDPVVISRTTEDRFADQKNIGYRFVNMRTNSGIYNKLKAYPFMGNPFWYSFIHKCTRDLKLDCIFLRETNLILPAIVVAKRMGIPLFVDARENMPLLHDTSIDRKVYKVWEHPKFIRLYESVFLPKIDHVFTVTDELKEWIGTNYKVDKNKISVLGNYPEMNYIKDCVIPINIQDRFNGEIKLVFAGGVSRIKGVQDIVECMPHIIKKRDCTLTIIGDGPFLNEIKRRVKSLGLSNHVIFRPLLPPEEVVRGLQNYDIGICPYLINDFTHQTMPGKLFEYMAASLPILSSPRKPVVRVIEKSGCGYVYEGRDPQRIAERILYMAENKYECTEMGMRGRDAVLNFYNIETTMSVLRDVLKNEYITKTK